MRDRLRIGRRNMGVLDRLDRLDLKMGFQRMRPRPGEIRRDFFDRVGNARFQAYVPRSVYLELVELHDRVAALEARLDSK